MKKLLSMMVIMLAMGTTFLFAFGIGVQGGTNINGGGGETAITFKLDDQPWIFAANGTFNNNYVAIGLTADSWMATKKLTGPVNYFYGWGVATFLGIGDNLSLRVGGRALAGLNFFLLDKFVELYAQAVWQPSLNILPNFSPSLWNFHLAGGVRFWIK